MNNNKNNHTYDTYQLKRYVDQWQCSTLNIVPIDEEYLGKSQLIHQ
jgi:hypothetical protein